MDFTGGVPESVDLTKMELSSGEVRDNLFGDILDASENRALIMCHMSVSLQSRFIHMNNISVIPLKQCKTSAALPN